MKKHVFLLLILFSFSLICASCAPSVTPQTSAPDASSDVTDEPSSEAELSVPEESSEAEDDMYHGVAQLYISDVSGINRDEYVGCTLRLVDKSGTFEEITDTDGLIRIRGNSTASGEKKPYNIKFSSSQSPLGLGKGKKFCLLANLYDKTLMRNRLSYDMAAQIGGCHYTPRTEFVDVYLNNRFLGNYLMTQPVSEGKERVDIDITKNEFLLEYEPYEGYSNPVCIRSPRYGILLGFNDPEQPTDAQLAWLGSFLEEAEATLATHRLDEIEKYFDIDSFVDFYIVNELFKDVDFATSSTRFYIKGDKIYAGPLWDMDLSAGNVNENVDYYDEYHNRGSGNNSAEGFFCRKLWYAPLFECGEFEELFESRYRELQPMIENLTTDNSLGKNRIDTLIDVYGESFEANYVKAGWIMSRVYGDYETRYPAATFAGNVEQLRSWLIERNSWILNALQQE